MRLSRKIGLVAASSLVSLSAYAQQSVQWDVDRAVLAGTGCVKDSDAFLSENGNDLSIVFTSLGVSLPGGGSNVLAARSTCLARVPAKIAAGLYIGELTQLITYGVTKSARSEGSMAVRSTFFGHNVSPYTVIAPYGRSVNNPMFTEQRRDLFSVHTQPDWYGRWCNRNRSPQGLYQANFAVSGRKDSRNDSLLLAIDGLDLKYEVVAGLVACQL